MLSLFVTYVILTVAVTALWATLFWERAKNTKLSFRVKIFINVALTVIVAFLPWIGYFKNATQTFPWGKMLGCTALFFVVIAVIFIAIPLLRKIHEYDRDLRSGK